MGHEPPLPLVTATFTTDELAKMSAGLHLLRKFWAKKASEWMYVSSDRAAEALQTLEETNDLFNRIGGLITKEQGNALLSGLIREKMKDDG